MLQSTTFYEGVHDAEFTPTHTLKECLAQVRPKYYCAVQRRRWRSQRPIFCCGRF